MYLLGHIALGYISGKIITKITGKDFNTILIWIISVSPDLDLLIPGLVHRGASHSIISAIIFFIPIFIIYDNAYPYLAALLSHSLIGDYFTIHGSKLLWPLRKTFYVSPLAWPVRSPFGILVEALLFTLMIFIMRPRNPFSKSRHPRTFT